MPKKGSHRLNFSKEEYLIIHQCLCAYPSNYKEGFRQAIIRIENELDRIRSIKSLTVGFYDKRSLLYKYFQNNPIQKLHSNEVSVPINRKNIAVIKDKSHPDFLQTLQPQTGIVQQSNDKMIIMIEDAKFEINGITIIGKNIQIIK